MAEDPDGVHALLRRCDEALMWLYRLIEARVEKEEYGSLAHSLWLERGVPFLSDDSAGLLSPAMYAEFGAPYTDAMLARFGGGFLHFHTMAYHQQENLCRMRALTMYNWRQDPNTPYPYECMEMFVAYANTIFDADMVDMTDEERAERIRALAFNAERMLGAESGSLMKVMQSIGGGHPEFNKLENRSE
jgi:hypothetical protein